MSKAASAPTYGRALRVWWAFTWRWAVGVAVGCVVVGLPIGMFRAMFGLDSQTVLNITSWVTFPLVIAAQVDAFRRILAAEAKLS